MILGVITSSGGNPPEALPGHQVTGFLREYFADCEGSAADDDPEVRWLLEAASEPEITLVGTDDFGQVPDALPPGRPDIG